jgi:hypothetical protein
MIHQESIPRTFVHPIRSALDVYCSTFDPGYVGDLFQPLPHFLFLEEMSPSRRSNAYPPFFVCTFLPQVVCFHVKIPHFNYGFNNNGTGQLNN